MTDRRSYISAHHNYVINSVLSPGFVIGDPASEDEFYFLADLVLPGESTSRISARLFDAHGNFLIELNWNRIVENPTNCSFKSTPEGFHILYPGGEILLGVTTQHFTNGHLTHINGRLYDAGGTVRIEPYHEDIRTHDDDWISLRAPYKFSRR